MIGRGPFEPPIQQVSEAGNGCRISDCRRYGVQLVLAEMEAGLFQSLSIWLRPSPQISAAGASHGHSGYALLSEIIDTRNDVNDTLSRKVAFLPLEAIVHRGVAGDGAWRLRKSVYFAVVPVASRRSSIVSSLQWWI